MLLQGGGLLLATPDRLAHSLAAVVTGLRSLGVSPAAVTDSALLRDHLLLWCEAAFNVIAATPVFFFGYLSRPLKFSIKISVFDEIYIIIPCVSISTRLHGLTRGAGCPPRFDRRALYQVQPHPRSRHARLLGAECDRDRQDLADDPGNVCFAGVCATLPAGAPAGACPPL